MEIFIIKAVLTAIFALAVLGKITGKTKLVFQQAGFTAGVMYATGFAELILAAALFTSYDLFATIGLLFIMGGALFTLVRLKAEPAKYILALITVILLLILLGLQVSKSAIVPG